MSTSVCLCIKRSLFFSLLVTLFISTFSPYLLFASVQTSQKDIQVAPVIIDGRALFKVVGVSTYSAKKRAKFISKRIIQLAEDKSVSTSSLAVRRDNEIVQIVAGDTFIMKIFQGDAQLEGDFTPWILANSLIVDQITEAIKNYRHERNKKTIIKNIYTAIWRTAALIIVLFVLFFTFKKLDHLLEQHFKRKVESLESKSKKILKARQIWALFKFIIRLAKIIFILITVYIFIHFVLNLFPWTRYLAMTLLVYITDPLHVIVQGVIDYLPNLFFLIFFYLFIRYLLRATHAFFNRVESGKIQIPNFEAEWSWPTYRIVRVIFFILGVVIAYPYIPGSGTEAFKGVTLLLGVLLSLGSTSLIANLIAGYTMTYRKVFKVGDRVKIGEHVGDVTKIRVLETHLLSLKNEEIVIPNSLILNGEVVNYSSLATTRGVVLHTSVGIGYEVPWRQVEAMLLHAAKKTQEIMHDPKPFVLLKTLGDFSVTYELNVFTQKAEKMAQIYSDIHKNIQDVFNEYEIAIMTPHYVADTDQPKISLKKDWFAAPAYPPAD